MIHENMILTNVSANEWKEVVEITGKLLVENDYTEEGFTQAMIDTVIDLGPYMILLPKVAFFHAPPSPLVKRNGLSLAVLSESVYFKEFENQEIKCAFAFCATDSTSHLEMLQNFSHLLGNEEFINLITSNGSKEDILEKVKEISNNDL